MNKSIHAKTAFFVKKRSHLPKNSPKSRLLECQKAEFAKIQPNLGNSLKIAFAEISNRKREKGSNPENQGNGFFPWI